jgi:hypothetical protein
VQVDMSDRSAGAVLGNVVVGHVMSLMAETPVIAAFFVRDWLGRSLGSFRRAFLARHKGTGLHELARRSVFYLVRPKDLKLKRTGVKTRGQFVAAGIAAQTLAETGSKIEAARRTLAELDARIWSTSEVTRLHETGGSITASGKLMTVPLPMLQREIERTPRVAGGRGVPSARDAIKSVAYWRARGDVFQRGSTLYVKIGRGRPQPFWALKSSVTLPGRLGFFSTWRSLDGDRERKLQMAADAIVAEATGQTGKLLGAAGATTTAPPFARGSK